jgi:hypothetical protein
MKLRANYNHQIMQVPPPAYDAIDDELEILYRHMVAKTMGVLAHFLSFMEYVTTIGAYNMLVLMLDLKFKGLKCVIDFLGHDKAKLLSIEYDNKILIPLLVKCSHFLNLDVVSTCTSIANGPLDSLFDIPILSAEANEGLLLTKLCLFHQCAMNLNDDARSPLLWWKEHVRLYPNVAFLLNKFWQFMVYKLK